GHVTGVQTCALPIWVNLPELRDRFRELLVRPVALNGYSKAEQEIGQRFVVLTGVDGQAVDVPLTGGGAQEPETVPEVRAPLTSEIGRAPCRERGSEP